MSQQTEQNPEVIKWRQNKIIAEAGGSMTMKKFCNEHIRRGWAFNNLTPESMGYEETDIISLTNPQTTAALRSH